jgi:hypothetical protein
MVDADNGCLLMISRNTKLSKVRHTAAGFRRSVSALQPLPPLDFCSNTPQQTVSPTGSLRDLALRIDHLPGGVALVEESPAAGFNNMRDSAIAPELDFVLDPRFGVPLLLLIAKRQPFMALVAPFGPRLLFHSADIFRASADKRWGQAGNRRHPPEPAVIIIATHDVTPHAA